MSELSEIVDRLTELSDADLLAVIRTATAGRSTLAPVHEAAADMPAETGYVHPHSPVGSTTDQGSEGGAAASGVLSGQVGAVSAAHTPVVGSAPAAEVGGYSPGGVPTFGSVRDKVEQRFGTAQGMGELDQQTPAGRGADKQWEAREKAARERLDQIRNSLRNNDAEAPEA